VIALRQPAPAGWPKSPCEGPLALQRLQVQPRAAEPAHPVRNRSASKIFLTRGRHL